MLKSRLPFVRSAFGVAQIAACAFALWQVLAQENGWQQWCYLALLHGLLALVIYALTRRALFSVTIVALAFYAVLRISAAKLAYLRSPLQVDDALMLLDPGIVGVLLKGYPGLAGLFIGGIVAALAYTVLALTLERPRALYGTGDIRSSGAIALVALAVTAVIVPGPGALSVAATDNPALIQGDRGFNLVSQFLGSITRTGLQHPAVSATTGPWPVDDASKPTGETTAHRAQWPDIIVVLEESTFNPQALLPSCVREACQRTMFGASPNSAASGPLRVHVTGGLTTLSEFALFTGLPHTLFGTSGLRAPVSVLPRTNIALPRWLKTLGYRTIAVYPLEKRAFGAALAYPLYGFDEIREYPFPEKRDFRTLSDREIFVFVEQVLAQADAASGQRVPVMIYAPTLQQHGPHGVAQPGQPVRPAVFAGLDFDASAKLDDYLHRLARSDEAIKALDAALARRGRPYVLVHFGDHLPAFEGLMRGLPKRAPAAGLPTDYVTYYNIQTGGLTAGSRRIADAYPTLDIAFLGGLMLDVAGLPRDPYFAANARLRHVCKGLFTECADEAALSAYQRYLFDGLKVANF